MMLNYYEICNLSPSASQEEIKKTIYQLMRLWSHRTNAPQMERRQEAERMVRLLEEAEEILLDEEKRKEYDKQLRRSIGIIATNTEETSYSSSFHESTPTDQVTATKEKVEELSPETIEEMIQQAQELLSSGSVNDALFLAEKLSKEVSDRAEVWSLVGHCRFKLGNYHEAIAPFVKASDLEPENPEYVYDLGEVFEKLGNQARALEQFKRASSLKPDDIHYRFKVGMLMVDLDQVQNGLPLLEQCYRVAPENPVYQIELAKAYEKSAFKNWITIYRDHPYLSPGIYPIRRTDLSLADAYINRAIQIPFDDSELRNRLQQHKGEIQKRKGRQFTGSWIMAALSFIFLIYTQYVNPSVLNFVFIGLPFIYIVSALTPKYRIYQKAYQNKTPKTDFAYIFAQLKERLGAAGAWLVSVILVFGYFWITAFVMSIVIIYNFIRNFF